MPNAPAVKRPTKSAMLRDVNRDLLLGMLIPGPDKFEVRGWVRWLVGDPQAHVPQQDEDRRRFEQLSTMDEDELAEVRQIALAAVDALPVAVGSPAFERGIMAHDTLMAVLLQDESNMDALRLSAFEGDTDRLLDMLHIDQVDLDDADFHAGFGKANRDLASAVAGHLNETE